ncbi:hypothetical protein ACSAZL_20065 [Methanosarcina sp. T3]|uniref:hypothetical protein n=1 Tax=Methanosarcina sp. T3 TaxID=3439062 RepID=UPI003F85125D
MGYFKSGLKMPGVEIINTGWIKHPLPIPRLFQKSSGAKSEPELNNQLIAIRGSIPKPEEVSRSKSDQK